MAKDPEERFESCGALVGRGAGGARPGAQRGAGAAAGAAARRRVGRSRSSRARGRARRSPGGDGAARRTPPPGRSSASTRATNAVARPHRRSAAIPGQLVVTPGGLWMADFRGGVLWRYEPGAAPLERITSNGEPRDLAALGGKVYVGADGRYLSGVVSRYDAVTGVRGDAIDLLACAMASGEGVVWAAGCPFVQRLSTDERPAAEARPDLPAVHDAGDRREQRASSSASSPSAPARSGCWATRSTGGSGASTPARGESRRRSARLPAHLGRRRRRDAWITDGLHDRVVPVDADGDRLLAPIRGRRAARAGSPPGAGGVWVANTLDGTLSRIDPRTRRVVATVDVGAVPRRSRSGAARSG